MGADSISVIKVGDVLMVTVPPDPDDETISALQLSVLNAMERHEAGDARVIPVILRACDWQSAPFGKLQALPKDAKPVTSWGNQDEAFTDIAKFFDKYLGE